MQYQSQVINPYGKALGGLGTSPFKPFESLLTGKVKQAGGKFIDWLKGIPGKIRGGISTIVDFNIDQSDKIAKSLGSNIKSVFGKDGAAGAINDGAKGIGVAGGLVVWPVAIAVTAIAAVVALKL